MSTIAAVTITTLLLVKNPQKKYAHSHSRKMYEMEATEGMDNLSESEDLLLSDACGQEHVSTGTHVSEASPHYITTSHHKIPIHDTSATGSCW